MCINRQYRWTEQLRPIPHRSLRTFILFLHKNYQHCILIASLCDYQSIDQFNIRNEKFKISPSLSLFPSLPLSIPSPPPISLLLSLFPVPLSISHPHFLFWKRFLSKKVSHKNQKLFSLKDQRFLSLSLLKGSFWSRFLQALSSV